jgi:transportin-3
LEAYIVNVKSLTTLPATCVATPNAVYGVIEELLAKYSSSYGVADKATRVIRRGLSFFPEVLIRPLVPRILARSVACFESSGHSSYIWLVDRVASSLGGKGRATLAAEESAVFEGALTSALEQLTSLVKSSETQQGATQIPDGM